MAKEFKSEESSTGWGGLKRIFSDAVGKVSATGAKLNFNLFSDSARIAVVGASRSGKTVLLTSLIDHLRNHDPRWFRLKPSPYSKKDVVRIEKFEVLDVTSGMDAFPYAVFRQSLIHDACWPQKTKDNYQYRLKIYRDDSALDRVANVKFATSLSFLDFPGERIADAPITSLSFSEWSDYMLSSLPSGEPFHHTVDAFQKTLADPSIPEGEIIDAYKRILSERLRRFHTAISPSTFLLSPEGTSPERGMTDEEIMKNRFCGVSENQQFCPLDVATRVKRPELVSIFSQAYEEYRHTLILPLYKALARSDHLCILINIPEILQSGVEAYNDHIELLQQIVGFCCPKKNVYLDVLRQITKSVGKIFIDDQYRPGGLEKIAFVGSQADRVGPDDINRLKKLVGDLQRASTRGLPHIEIKMDSFTCVAVQATRPAKDGGLQGRLMASSSKVKGETPTIEAYTVPHLPEEWPANWNPDDYAFPDVLPKFNQNKNIPPEQIGLDRIFNYLIS